MVNKHLLAGAREYNLIFNESYSSYAEFRFNPMPVINESMYLTLHTTAGDVVLPLIIPFNNDLNTAQQIAALWSATINDELPSVAIVIGTDNFSGVYGFWMDSNNIMRGITLHYSGKEKTYGFFA